MGVNLMNHHDVLIIGSGIAALQLAVHLHHDKNVRILTKSLTRTANSYLAQGGVAAAIGKNDHPSKHYIDTLEAGRNHNHRQTVHDIIGAAPELINELYRQGASFDHDDSGALLLGMEGAHSEKRIIHGGGDATGKTIVEFLVSQLYNKFQIEENIFVYELILDESKQRCIGVKGKTMDGTIRHFYANHIVLATGGCGQLYSFTSNAETVTGDGIAMAYLAGAEVTDMEFIQFHPTLLYVNGAPRGLVSEAVRGEGAKLITEDGKRIMEGVHPLKDLAPRHVTSQTIFNYVKNGQQVYLDIRSIKDFESRFPSITDLCKQNEIDLSAGKIPVVPGSHFLMGGIKTDAMGKSTLPGLYAIGEASCTGLHGANRLASNSLLEGLYQGKKLAEYLNTALSKPLQMDTKKSMYPIKQIQINLPELATLQARMMEYVGIIREKTLLKEQQHWLEQFRLKDFDNLDGLSVGDISRIYMVIVAELITKSALKRTESRGGHFRSDYPFEDDVNWCGKQTVHKCKKEVENQNESIKAALAT
jgi:L-aspartate oxidase